MGAAFARSARATDARTEPGAKRGDRAARLSANRPGSLSGSLPHGAGATAAGARSHGGPGERQSSATAAAQDFAPAYHAKARRAAVHGGRLQRRQQGYGAGDRQQ